MHLKALISVFSAIALNAFAAETSYQDDESTDLYGPRSISPDGRYALLVTEGPGGDSEKDRVQLIELSTRRGLAELREPGDEFNVSIKAKLFWSEDSKRVAAHTGWKRGGTTRISVREGDGFAEVRLPALPHLPDEPSAEVLKKHPGGFPRPRIIEDLTFVRWLDSGGVILDLSNCWGGETGTMSRNIRVTIEIDAQRKARITSSDKKETFDKD